MAEALGIYAFIIGVSISTGTDPKVKPCFLFYGYVHFSRGLAGGMAIGIVGDAGVRARGCLELSSPFLPRIGCPHRSNPSRPFPAGLVLSKLLTIIVDYHGKEAFTTGGDFGPSEEGNRTSLC